MSNQTYAAVCKNLKYCYDDVYNAFKDEKISAENNVRLYRAIGKSVMEQEKVYTEDEWVRNHYMKSTVCTIALAKLGYSTIDSNRYISHRSGVLALVDDKPTLMRQLIIDLEKLASV